MNPLLPGHSGTAPEPTRNTTRNNQGTNEDGSQTDLHPEASLFHGQREQNSGTGNDYDMVTGATETNQNRYDMATGVQRERACTTMTWWQEPQNRTEIATTWLKFTKKLLTAPLAHLQESRKRTALPVNRNSAVKTALRRSRQTKFCKPFNSWQTTTILRISTILLTGSPNYQNQ